MGRTQTMVEEADISKLYSKTKLEQLYDKLRNEQEGMYFDDEHVKKSKWNYFYERICNSASKDSGFSKALIILK